MKPLESASFQLDQLQAGFRWLLLLGAALVAVFVSRPETNLSLGTGALLLGGAFNLLLLFLGAAGQRFAYLPELSVVLDALLAIALFQLSGRASGPFGWAGIFPVFVVGLYFSPLAAIGTAAAVAAAFGVLGVTFDSAGAETMIPLVLDGLLLVAAAVAVGLVGKRIRATLNAMAQASQEEMNRRLRQVRDRSQAIFEMASTVSATLDYERVLNAALDLGTLGVADLGDVAQQTVSAVLLFDGDALEVSTARRLGRADLAVRVTGRKGIIHQALSGGETVQSADPSRDDELAQFAAFRACRSLICLPLGAGFETFGVILFGHPRDNFFQADHLQLLEAIGNQAMIALQNAKLYLDLRAEKERIIEVEEDARKKLARDLHDGPTQSIAAIAMRVNYVRRLINRDLATAADELFKIEDLARRTTKEIRHMLFTLRPLILESQGLLAAVKQLAEKTLETHGQRVIVESHTGLVDELDLGKQGVIFYIAEEAVGNARKHAQAAHIWVRLKGNADVFVLEIQDDGVGFNVGAVDASYDQRGSLGMVNMRERTELVNGLLRVESAEGKGTKISVLVPLSEDARERLRNPTAVQHGERSEHPLAIGAGH